MYFSIGMTLRFNEGSVVHLLFKRSGLFNFRGVSIQQVQLSMTVSSIWPCVYQNLITPFNVFFFFNVSYRMRGNAIYIRINQICHDDSTFVFLNIYAYFATPGLHVISLSEGKNYHNALVIPRETFVKTSNRHCPRTQIRQLIQLGRSQFAFPSDCFFFLFISLAFSSFDHHLTSFSSIRPRSEK